MYDFSLSYMNQVNIGFEYWELESRKIKTETFRKENTSAQFTEKKRSCTNRFCRRWFTLLRRRIIQFLI